MVIKKLRRKDNKLPIVGTKEITPGCAYIHGIDEHGAPVYEGGTAMWWDEQRTLEEDGGPIYLDEDGHEVLHHQVEEYDEGAEQEP